MAVRDVGEVLGVVSSEAVGGSPKVGHVGGVVHEEV